MTKTSTTNLSKTIDTLGELNAQIAELQTKAKAIKDSLGDLKPGAYEGDLFRLTLSQSIRETLDMDAVREKLSPQFITAHTRQTEVRTFKLGARTGKNLA
jgi:hypothetical protein